MSNKKTVTVEFNNVVWNNPDFPYEHVNGQVEVPFFTNNQGYKEFTVASETNSEGVRQRVTYIQSNKGDYYRVMQQLDKIVDGNLVGTTQVFWGDGVALPVTNNYASGGTATTIP